MHAPVVLTALYFGM